MIDTAIPNDCNLCSAIEGIKAKEEDWSFQLTQLWGIKNISVIPTVLKIMMMFVPFIF